MGKFSFAVAVPAAALAGLFATGVDALDISVAVANPPDDPASVALMRMKEQLDNGETGLSLTVYTSGQLGGEADLVEQVRLGALDMTTVAASVISTFSPTMGVLDIPYLLSLENDQVWRVLDGPIGEQIGAQMEEDTGMRLVAYWSAGERSVFTRDRLINSPEDLAGLRIRVIPSPVYLDTFNALGAEAVGMPYAEVYTSLATGAIDGAEQDTSGFRVMKFYEQAAYYSFTKHILLIRPLVMNPAVLDEMTPEQRAEFDAAIADATEFQRQYILDMVADNMTYLAEQGVQFAEPDLAAFRELAAPVREDYAKTLGADLIAAIEAIE